MLFVVVPPLWKHWDRVDAFKKNHWHQCVGDSFAVNDPKVQAACTCEAEKLASAYSADELERSYRMQPEELMRWQEPYVAQCAHWRK